MCNCKDIDIGSYDNQITIIAPKWSSRRYLCIDACLFEEITRLWKLSIITNGCCCGHNKEDAYIGVDEESHDKMIELGYEYYTNQFGSNCYKPKTNLTK